MIHTCVLKMGLVDIFQTLGICNTNFLSEFTEMGAQPSIAQAVEEVVGKFVREIDIGVRRVANASLGTGTARVQRLDPGRLPFSPAARRQGQVSVVMRLHSRQLVCTHERASV